MECFKDKKIAVLGFGVEGQSVCDFLSGVASQVTVFDESKRSDFDEDLLVRHEEQGIKFLFGKIGELARFDAIFRSPGFHPNLPFFEEARKNGIEITSATKAFFDLCP